MELPAWLIPAALLAVAGFIFLRLLAIGRERALTQAEAEAADAARRKRHAEQLAARRTQSESDVELVEC